MLLLPQVDDGQGPKFGSEGLTILLERSRPKKVRCKLGLYYERLPDGGNTFLSGGKAEDELVDLKIFIGSYAPGEMHSHSSIHALLKPLTYFLPVSLTLHHHITDPISHARTLSRTSYYSHIVTSTMSLTHHLLLPQPSLHRRASALQ